MFLRRQLSNLRLSCLMSWYQAIRNIVLEKHVPCFINCFKFYQTTNGKTFLYTWVQVGAIVRERERASKRRLSFHIILHVLIILFLLLELLLVFGIFFYVKCGQLSSLKPKNTLRAHILEKINSAKCPAETCNNKVAIEAQKCLTVYIYPNLWCLVLDVR